MLVEASIKDLINSTNQIETKARQHIAYQVRITNGFQVLRVGRDLVFQGHTSTGHDPKIRLIDYQESQQGDSTKSTPIVTVAQQEIDLIPMTKHSQVYVTCNCEDFIYRFATTNQKNGVLFGHITRPTIPKTSRPSSNLGQIGVCKHLIKFIDLLTAEQILK